MKKDSFRLRSVLYLLGLVFFASIILVQRTSSQESQESFLPNDSLQSLPPQGEDTRVRVMTSVEPNNILVGQQAKLTIKVASPLRAKVQIFLPKDTIVRGVEYLMRPKLIDSTEVSSDIVSRVYEVPITAFDSATYTLKNIAALVDGALYEQVEAPLFNATNIPVDLSKPDEFAPNKEIWKAPFVWKDYLWILYLILGLIALACVVFYTIKYLHKKKDTQFEEVQNLDPYEEAKKQLEHLRDSELWKKGEVKEHYTLVTDTLRLFMQRLLAISTLDKTSAEIIQQLEKKSEISREQLLELSQLFKESDLVKFAKYHPDDAQNLRVLSTSERLVDEIKENHDIEQEKQRKETEQLQKQQQANIKKSLKESENEKDKE